MGKTLAAKRLFILIVILTALPATIAAFIFFMRGHQARQALNYICDSVYEKHYYGKDALRDWYRECKQGAHAVSRSANTAELIAIAQDSLAAIATSHLDVYSPAEDKLVWSGQQDSDSGMRARAINGRMIVARVYPKSAAEAAGVRLGDEIVKIQNQDLLAVENIPLASGEVILRRHKNADIETITVKLEPKPLQLDGAPSVQRLAVDVGRLEISSFRQEYFHKESWGKLVDSFQDYPSLVVDVRGNLGGDFVAVLRALSVFLCKPTEVGELSRPQFPGNEKASIVDGESSEKLYESLTASRALVLKTFGGYPCYQGAVTVLADQDSASVAEIFAMAMKRRPQTRVWGERTRGDMLLGVWYALPLFGPGYTISIPEALYMAPNGEVIEGNGVQPTRELFYKLEDAYRGEDSWIKAAMSDY